MKVVVSITLLLFEFLMISAHVLPKSELENPPRDIYEVQEAGKERTTFLAPKPAKPTLREIVYYHVIERPYSGLKLEGQSEPLQIEMDESMRPFTNGHGYQFADSDLQETRPHESPELDPEDANEEDEEVIENSEKATEEKLTVKEKNSDVTTGTTVLNDEREITTEMNREMPKSTTPSEEKKIRQRQFLFDRLRERYSASFKKGTTTEKPELASSTEKVAIISSTEKDAIISSTEKDVITNSTVKVETSTTSTEAMTASTPAARVKRSVNYEEIPIAPTLPTIDYSQYPGIQVFTEPVYETADTEEESNQDHLKRSMKFKINDIFATMKPFNDDYEAATHTPEVKVKTYGMNLSDDQGTVWNNMWRPINYHVGEPVKFYEVNEYQVSTITPTAEETTKTTTKTESKDLEDIIVDDKKESTPKGTEDIYVDVTEEATETTTTEPKEGIIVEDKKESTPKNKDHEDIYVDVKKEKKDKHTTAKPDDTKMDEPTKELDEVKESKNVASRSLIHKKTTKKRKPTQDTKPDLYELLINSDKFWKWLAQWTSNYIEILSERIKNMVKEEVAKEIKKFDKGSNAHLHKTKDENKPNITDIAKHKEPVIKNNTLIIDGKEIPITNTSNLDETKDFLKKHKDRHEKPNHNRLNETKLENNKTISNKVTSNATKDEENYNNVNAHNIYGSATGNDQVTNVFIFYPGTETEKIIDSLKPLLDSSISGISTGNKDKIDKDNKESTTTQKPIETTLSSKDPDIITTPTPIKDDKANKTAENLPVDNKNSTKLEANKESNTPNADIKDSVAEKSKDATKKVTEKVIITSTTEMPKTTESSRNSTVTTTEKSDSSTTQASTDKSTEKSLDTTTISSPTETSSAKPSATTSALTDTSTETSTGSSTVDPVNSTTLASTVADTTTNKSS